MMECSTSYKKDMFLIHYGFQMFVLRFMFACHEEEERRSSLTGAHWEKVLCNVSFLEDSWHYNGLVDTLNF